MPDTPLIEATCARKPFKIATIELFLLKDANPNLLGMSRDFEEMGLSGVKDKDNSTALRIAVTNNFEEIEKVLRSYGTDLYGHTKVLEGTAPRFK